jgi:hypothetical protein|nr:unknown protein [uncultured bacterium]
MTTVKTEKWQNFLPSYLNFVVLFEFILLVDLDYFHK